MNALVNKIKNHPQFQKRPYLKQVFKFGLVGGFNTFLDFAIYFLLTRGIEFFHNYYLAANFISFGIAVVSSYILNKKWTFRDDSRKVASQFAKFMLVSTVGLLLNEAILFLLTEYAGFYDLLAKALAVGVVMVWNFLANKLWTFKQRNEAENNLSDNNN